MASFIRDVVRMSGTTTNATPTVLLTYSIPAGATVLVKMRALARSSSGVSATWQKDATVKNVSSVLSVIGAILDLLSPQKDAGALFWDVSVSVNSSNVTVTVTGGAATTIDWMIICGVDVLVP